MLVAGGEVISSSGLGDGLGAVRYGRGVGACVYVSGGGGGGGGHHSIRLELSNIIIRRRPQALLWACLGKKTGRRNRNRN